MSETKHTPGPWEFDRTTGSVAPAHGKPITYISSGRAERLYNGALIAAAPDLVMALQDVHTEFIGLAAYLETCSTEVVIDNLPTIIATLKRKRELVEAAILKAGCWV